MHIPAFEQILMCLKTDVYCSFRRQIRVYIACLAEDVLE